MAKYQASVFYSTTDVKAYDAGVWLNKTIPAMQQLLTLKFLVFGFQIFCGKNVISQTDAAEGTNDIAESVFSLSYQIQTHKLLLMAYGAKGGITDENYVSINHVWYQRLFFFHCWRFSLIYAKRRELQICLSHNLDEAHILLMIKVTQKRIAFTYSNDYADCNGYNDCSK